MNIQILHLIEGARQATGLTVIIDVFRAFTVEAYLSSNRAEKIIPVGDVEAAFAYKAKHPDTTILCGERGGVIIDGFDYGNSPSQLANIDLVEKTVVHTTSAGTQGIANAIHADEVIAGSLVCAKAIAEYIKQSNPETVSLVCMGLHGKRRTDEDTLCAEYIKALAEGKPFPQLQERIEQLKQTDGAKFFDPALQDVFPEQDFHMSVQADRFPFILRLKQDPDGGLAYMERIDMMDNPPEPEPAEYTKVMPGDRMSRFTPEQALHFPREVKAQLVYGDRQKTEGDFDCALVLGGPREFMASRAKAAAELYFAGRVPFLITTGGVCWNSPFGFLSEAQILAAYLEQTGVPRDRIICEDRATTTIENMRFCNTLLKERFPDRALRLAVVTSNFHASRATILARDFFPGHALYGIGAVYPKDNAAEFWDDPDLRQWIACECRCLCNYVKRGRIPDFPVL